MHKGDVESRPLIVQKECPIRFSCPSITPLELLSALWLHLGALPARALVALAYTSTVLIITIKIHFHKMYKLFFDKLKIIKATKLPQKRPQQVNLPYINYQRKKKRNPQMPWKSDRSLSWSCVAIGSPNGLCGPSVMFFFCSCWGRGAGGRARWQRGNQFNGERSWYLPVAGELDQSSVA